jgi:hypothetical protein
MIGRKMRKNTGVNDEYLVSCKGKIVYVDDCQKLIDCQKCGFIHVYPYPEQDILLRCIERNFMKMKNLII